MIVVVATEMVPNSMVEQTCEECILGISVYGRGGSEQGVHVIGANQVLMAEGEAMDPWVFRSEAPANPIQLIVDIVVLSTLVVGSISTSELVEQHESSIFVVERVRQPA